MKIWRKGTLVHYWWECKLVQLLWKTVWRFLKNLEVELPYDPAVPLLSIYSKKMKAVTQKDICILMFIAALFIIAKIWKQPKCSTVDEWIKKMWYIYKYICVYIKYINIHTHIYKTYTAGFYSAIKKRVKSCDLWQYRWILRVLC